MKVQFVTGILLCYLGVGDMQGAEDYLDADFTESIDSPETKNNVIDINKGDTNEEGMLPRVEKSLIGTFPFSGHSGHHPSSYNPRARQPANRNQGHGNQYNDGREDPHNHQDHHSHHDFHNHHDHHGHHQQASNQLLRFPFENVAPNRNEHHSHKNIAEEGEPEEKATIDKL